MTALILQPCSPGAPMQHYRDTVEHPVLLDAHRALLSAKDFATLSDLTTDGAVALWGLVPNRSVSRYDAMQDGDTVLFVGGRRGFFAGTVRHKFRNAPLAKTLWGVDDQGRTWEHMYAITDGREVTIHSSELNEALGYLPEAAIQGFTVKVGEPADRVLELLGNVRGTQRQDWVFQSNPRMWDLRTFLELENAGRYAVNQHRDKIAIGDRIWFRITGGSSGLYAVGEVTGAPEAVPNDFGNWTCSFQVMERIDPPLLTEEIKGDPYLSSARPLTGFQYTNAPLAPNIVSRLDAVVRDRRISRVDESQVAEAEVFATFNPRRTRPKRGGQGYGLTHAQKLAVEERAVALATKHFEAEGWVVEDVGKSRSYDLHATRGTQIAYVEVKGSTGPAESVLLTKNEVALHQDFYPATALFVVAGIELVEREGEWTGGGGTQILIQPWKPSIEDLEATVYRYRVPAASRTSDSRE